MNKKLTRQTRNIFFKIKLNDDWTCVLWLSCLALRCRECRVIADRLFVTLLRCVFGIRCKSLISEMKTSNLNSITNTVLSLCLDAFMYAAASYAAPGSQQYLQPNMPARIWQSHWGISYTLFSVRKCIWIRIHHNYYCKFVCFVYASNGSTSNLILS